LVRSAVRAILAPALLLPAAAPPSVPAPLVVEVSNVRAATGQVHIDVCPEALFLKDGCPVSLAAPAHPGMTTLTVRALPPGRWAVQAFYDENGNGRVDRALFGIPKEGVGFSRDAPIRLSPPKFADAVFDHGETPQLLRLKLRYFLGKSGPG
jgi:uncharacterized protein (DUF2141 family)